MAELLDVFVGDDPSIIPNPKTGRQKAMAAMMEYGSILVKKGLNSKYGVTIKQIPQAHRMRQYWPWGLYLHSYEEEESGEKVQAQPQPGKVQRVPHHENPRAKQKAQD